MQRSRLPTMHEDCAHVLNGTVVSFLILSIPDYSTENTTLKGTVPITVLYTGHNTDRICTVNK
jgi:hypothetical protein